MKRLARQRLEAQESQGHCPTLCDVPFSILWSIVTRDRVTVADVSIRPQGLGKKPQGHWRWIRELVRTLSSSSRLQVAVSELPMRSAARLLCSVFLALSCTGPSLAQARPETSQQVSVEQFQDWTWRCLVPEKDGDAKRSGGCEIRQTLQSKEGEQNLTLLRLAVSKASDKAGKVDWALVVVTPLNVALAADIGLSAGPTEPETIRYRNCTHEGCYAIFPLNEKRLQKMKSAQNGAIFFRVLNGQAIKVPFSLMGFTKAFNVLQSGRPSSSGKDSDQ